MQMLLTGDPITAQEAHRLGMVNEIHPQAGLMHAARQIAEKIASNRVAPLGNPKGQLRFAKSFVKMAGKALLSAPDVTPGTRKRFSMY